MQPPVGSIPKQGAGSNWQAEEIVNKMVTERNLFIHRLVDTTANVTPLSC